MSQARSGRQSESQDGCTRFKQWRGDWRRGSESNRRIKVLQTSPLPLGYRALLHTLASRRKKVHLRGLRRAGDENGVTKSGAGDGGRTRDIDLGKVALYH